MKPLATSALSPSPVSATNVDAAGTSSYGKLFTAVRAEAFGTRINRPQPSGSWGGAVFHPEGSCESSVP